MLSPELRNVLCRVLFVVVCSAPSPCELQAVVSFALCYVLQVVVVCALCILACVVCCVACCVFCPVVCFAWCVQG